MRFVPLSIFVLLICIFGFGLTLNPQKLVTPRIGQNLPQFDLPTLLGPTSRFRPDLFRNHMSILIIWASWCDACREEQAFLMTLAQQKHIRLYGLNYKDDPAKALQWLMDWGNPYQVIGADEKGILAMDLGAYGTPETYLIDSNGKIVHRYAGVLTESIWRREFIQWIA